jgi:hypothetical protein
MTIWVDAVCINQQDLKEKERQLKLMADIYSLARQVYIWLGEGTHESDAAIEYLNKAGFQEVLVEAGENQYEMPRSKLFYLEQAWKMFTCQAANLQALQRKYCKCSLSLAHCPSLVLCLFTFHTSFSSPPLTWILSSR